MACIRIELSMTRSPIPILLLAMTVAACSDVGEGGIDPNCVSNGSTHYVCLPENEKLLYQVDNCNRPTEQTKKCLNEKSCQPGGANANAFCGTADALYCPLEGFDCNCPDPSPPILGCHTKGAKKADEETTLSYVNGCGVLQEKVEVTCAEGERCWYTWNEDGTLNEAAGEHCASSMDPSQKDSPYYKMACDNDMFMHATTGMEIDCRCNGATGIQECKNGTDAWGHGLRLGTGPSIHPMFAGSNSKWGGGFIHEGEFFAAVHYTGGGAGGVKSGAIYAFDIKNGNRRVVSGSYVGDNGRVDVGTGHTVGGEALPFLNHVKLGADGNFYTFGSNTLVNVEITRVNPKTGDRTLVWRRQQPSEGKDPDFPYGQCFDGRTSNDYDSGFQPVQFAERAFALGPDGSFYVGWNNDGAGVVKISADGKTCTHVSVWAEKKLAKKGGGVDVPYGTVDGMLYYNGEIYLNTKDVLLAVDAVTGDRRVFSGVTDIGGIGETNIFVDEARQLMFACGTNSTRKCSIHRLDDGNYAQGMFEIGSGQPIIKGKYPQKRGSAGAITNKNHNGYGAVALDPEDPNIAYIVVVSGIIKFELNTGNSFFISM